MEKKPENQIQIELKEDVAQGIYCNLAVISHSSSEFIMDLIRMLPGMPKAQVQSRVILTPEHAVRLMHALDTHALVTHIAQGEGVAHGLVILREGAQVMGVVLATQLLGSLWVHLRTHDRVYLLTRKATHVAHRHLGNGAKREQ